MDKQKLQNKILVGTKSLFRLTSAISDLPEGETRDEMIEKHEQVAVRLANLQIELEAIDKNACYYGFVDRCPGCCCADCGYYQPPTAVLLQ